MAMINPMKEKMQTKLNSMASILLDDIIVPEKTEQQGSETISASFYDKFENRFTFNLSLTVVPKVKDEDPESETPVTLADQVAAILLEIQGLRNDVDLLKGYHTVDNMTHEADPTNNTDSTIQETDVNGQTD